MQRDQEKKQPKRDRWFADMLFYGPAGNLFFPILVVALIAICLPSLLRAQRRVVIVYSSQDQDFAEPIFQQFSRETHLKVRPVFGSEAVKTVGLANRLLAEKSH